MMMVLPVFALTHPLPEGEELRKLLCSLALTLALSALRTFALLRERGHFFAPLPSGAEHFFSPLPLGEAARSAGEG
jgi:hypothetical protein